MILSKLSGECKKCPHKHDCDNKKMVMCAALTPRNMKEIATDNAQSAAAPVLKEHTSIAIKMGEYGAINTSKEVIEDQLSKRLYSSMGVMQSGA